VDVVADGKPQFKKGEKRMKMITGVALLALLFVVPAAMAQTDDVGQDDTGRVAAASVNQRTFHLVPQAKFLACLQSSPNKTPKATVTVVRGELHDTLILTIKNIKPHLNFDLFTIEKTNLLANGSVDPNFVNFGLAWYQTDVHADFTGAGQVTIKTILIDQIFGFDPAASLAPTHTFHVGFWFNNPQDAVPCGFNASAPTPFNGEQNAGPNAMISVPDATTDLGPLCLSPDTSTVPATCHE
jgi:hypothetical protein